MGNIELDNAYAPFTYNLKLHTLDLQITYRKFLCIP